MGDVNRFTQNVKQMFELQDEMKAIAAEVKVRRDPIKERFQGLQDDVKEYMMDSQVDVCTYQEDRLELQAVTRFGSLTRKSALAALQDQLGPEKGQETFDGVMNFVGSKELHILKRLKNRKKKGAAPATTVTASSSSTPAEEKAPVLADDSDDE